MTHSPLSTIETLTDPTTATDREHVDRRARRSELSPDEFEQVAAAHEGIDGHVRVGVVDEDDRVLLLGRDDESTGWRPIQGEVAPDEDWIQAASDTVAATAGVEVESHTVEHVRRIEYLDATEGRSLKTYQVLLEAFAGEAPTVEDEPVEIDGEEWRLEWFESPPEVVAPEDEADVGYFFE